MNREQARHTSTNLIFTADEIARTFRRDKDDIEIGTGLHFTVKDREAVGDKESVTSLEIWLDVPRIDFTVRHVRSQQADELRLARCVGRRNHVKPIRESSLLGAATGTRADDYRIAAVTQVAGMSAALAAVANYRNRPFECRGVCLFVCVDPFHVEFSFHAKENPRSGWGAGVLVPWSLDRLEP
jgi:hypothetical protein